MRPKSIALLLLALGCGLVASVGITEVMKRNAKPEVVNGEMQPIFVAMTDIGLGDQLTPQVLKLEPWPKDKLPVGAITRIEDIEGRRARTKLYANEPILENRLLSKGASAQGATSLIPKGYRVVPVKVDLVSGGSSMILPGDRVDVMVHLESGRDIPETLTQTILQDIKVFAVDDVVDLETSTDGRKSIPAKTISLLVTPEQAAKLMLAARMGSINLVMRSPEDDAQSPVVQARPRELFDHFTRPLKADRSKETLAEGDESPKLDDKASQFMQFLNSMNASLAGQKVSHPTEKPEKPELWTMRVLKPQGVDEVTLERNTGVDGAAWRLRSWNEKKDPQAPAKAIVGPSRPPLPRGEPVMEKPAEPDAIQKLLHPQSQPQTSPSSREEAA